MGHKQSIPSRCIIVTYDDYTEYRWRNDYDCFNNELHIVQIYRNGTLKQFCHLESKDSHSVIGQISPPCDHRNDVWNFIFVKHDKKKLIL